MRTSFGGTDLGKVHMCADSSCQCHKQQLQELVYNSDSQLLVLRTLGSLQFSYDKVKTKLAEWSSTFSLVEVKWPWSVLFRPNFLETLTVVLASK